MRNESRQSLDIVDLDDEGRGIGAAAGTNIHVAGALPGDRACVVVEHRSPHEATAWARLVTIERASALRTAPVCPATGRCGGCPLGAFDYPAQLAWKQRRLLRALESLTTCPPPQHIVASPAAVGYRNATKFVYGSPRKDAVPCLGGYAPRSHRLVDLAGCRVAESPLDDVRAAVLAVLNTGCVAPYDEGAHEGLLGYVALRSNWRGDVLVTLVGTNLEALARIADGVAEAHPAIVGVTGNLRPAGNTIFGPDTRTFCGRGELDENVAGTEIVLSPTAFFQVNRAVASAMYRELADAFVGRARGAIADLYSGVGGIALTLAASGCEDVVGIEVNKEAVRDAARAAATSGLSVRFLATDAAQGLRAEAAVRQIDAVVVNPPRRGLDGNVKAVLGTVKPQFLAYMSCNPDSLARDLAELSAQGFCVTSIRPYDMHPQTPHVEILALLERNA